MAYCSKCGAQVSDGVKFCTSCGTSISSVQQSQVAPQQHSVAPPPVQPFQQQSATPPSPQPQAAVYTEEPITTGGYIGILFLMMIPIVNVLCLIVWACGGCNKRNKTNLSRAMLVWMLISAILGGIVTLVSSIFLGEVYSELMQGFTNEYMEELYELKDLTDSLKNFQQ